jgi:hypothetical protein
LTIANVVEWKTTELRITSGEWAAPVLAWITDCKAKGPAVRAAVDADERDPFKRSYQGNEALKKRSYHCSLC